MSTDRRARGERTILPSPRPAVALDVRGLVKAYDIGSREHTLRRFVLRDVSLWVAAGECLAIVGCGLAPRTLLRCAAGLAHPSGGTITWRDADAERTAPPPRALVPADWCASAGCLSVGDVLEAAAPRTLWQREADAHVVAALDLCTLRGALRRRVSALSPSERWLVGLGVAVAAGARWLFLEPPPARRGSLEQRTRHVSPRPGRRHVALLALRAAGHTVVASVEHARVLPATRVLLWRDGALTLPGGSPAGDVLPWRVAEPEVTTLPVAARVP